MVLINQPVISRVLRSRQAAGVALSVLAVVVMTQVIPHRIPMGTVLFGVIAGSLNGLLAMGLVLLFRVTRSINFAYGAMGSLPAGIACSLYLGHHWPWPAVIVFAVALGGLVGVAVGTLIDRRFGRSSRLLVTVATIGIEQLLGGIAIFVPQWFHGPNLIANFRTGLSKMHTEVTPVVFNGNDLVALLVVPAVVALVAWFLLGTDAGRAVRAIAENPDRARLVGVPVRRLLTMVWALSGMVAALAVMLQAPRAGVPLDAATGPEVLLAPLAAAIVARMESLYMAFAAAVGLGLIQAVVGLNVSKQAVQTPVFLLVILLALLIQRRPAGRASAEEDGSWAGGAGPRPVPQILRGLPEVRAARAGGWMILAALLVTLPMWLSAARLDEVSVALVFGLGSLSLVVLSGWGGTVSLGQFAVIGIGAIVAGDLMMHLDLDFFLSMVLAAGAGSVAAVILGLPALRVRGLYLSVTTLAFAVAASDYFYNPTNYPSLLPSQVLRPVLWKRFDLHGEGDLYILGLLLVAVTVVLINGMRIRRPGRAIIAVRDNSRAGSAMALPGARTKMTAFMVSGAIAGVAGAFYVAVLGDVGYQTFPTADSVTVFAMAVIGGLTSVPGALAGVALLQWLGIAFPKVQILLSGVGLLVVLAVFPSGLSGLFEKLRDAILARVASLRGLDLSAWADEAPEADVTPASGTPAVGTGFDHVTSGDDILLRCSSVGAAYGPMQVLFGVDVEIREGEILALLGTNGAGKSSLLRAVTGLLPPKSGEVSYGGTVVTGRSPEALARAGLTMMPGGRGVFPGLTVAENMSVAAWMLRGRGSEAESARERMYCMFPILRDRSGQLAGNLSGGEQQMLSLAMAFLVRPRLLCIDELSLGLAPTVVSALLDAVREIHRQGTTVVIVEQSVEVALVIAERAIFMEKGQVRFSGRAADLRDRPDLLRAVFIGGTSPTRASNGSGSHVPGNAVTTVKGRDEASDGGARQESSMTPALQCKDVVVRFGGITAVDHVDLEVRPGELVGLIGHNGAGKTTLFDAISGFTRPDEGRILIDGYEVTSLPAHERAWSGLGRSFQEARLFPTLTVAETITVALETRLENRSLLAAAFAMPAALDSEAAASSQVHDIIDRLGLAAYRNRPTGELSTGTRRIVELACILASRPSLLLLDEPSGGVAQAETEALGPMLRGVAAELGCAMVVIEHDMNFLSSLCERLVALETGRVIASGTPAEVLSHPEVIASYLGTDSSAIARSTKPKRVRKSPASAGSGPVR